MSPLVMAILGTLFVIAAILVLIFLAVLSRYFWLWIQAIMTGANVGLGDLIGMMFRRVDARMIVRSKIMAVAAGIDDPELTTKALEAHYLQRQRSPSDPSPDRCSQKSADQSFVSNGSSHRFGWPRCSRRIPTQPLPQGHRLPTAKKLSPHSTRQRHRR